MPAGDEEATMSGDDSNGHYEPLDYAGTLAKLTDLVGRDVIIELRIGSLRGPCRLAARGVIVGSPAGQPRLTALRPPDDDLEAFMLDTGGFLALKEQDFVRAQWHAGSDEGQRPTQPHLNVVFADAVVHIAVLWRHDPSGSQGT
jgi:hypothetical protein